ncbi:MAG: two-component regulator propeller domain-containing protein [Leptospirillia bacterium]
MIFPTAARPLLITAALAMWAGFAHAGQDFMAPPDTAATLVLVSADLHADDKGRYGGGAPPLPEITSFETGGNVKALAMQGRNLWMGLPSGLIRYNVDSFDDHEIFTVESTRTTAADGTEKPGLLSNGVYALDFGPDGALWVSTYGGGLSRYHKGKWTTYTPVEGLGDRWAYDVEFAKDGSMWVATWKGASLFDGKQFTTFTEKHGLIDKWVYDIEIADDGKVWMGTEGGVSVYDGKTFTNYTHANGLGADIPEAERKPVAKAGSRHHRTAGKANQGYNPNYVLGLAFDPDGSTWVGTWGAGLSRFDGKSWVTYTTKEGLGGNFIHALAFDPQGLLWAATDGGVSYLKNGRWTTLTTRDGLMDDNVFSLLFEKDGTRWFGTWQGLSKVGPSPAPSPRPSGHPASPHG